MMQKPHPATDLTFCLFILVIAALLLGGASVLPPARWEPLGSAALPRALAVLLIVFAAFIGGGAVLRLWRRHETLPLPFSAPALVRGGGVLICLVAFIASMVYGLLTFWLAGTLFVLASSLLIGGFNLRRLAISAAISIPLCAAMAVLFSRFFFVNLP